MLYKFKYQQTQSSIISRAFLVVSIIILIGITAGCTHQRTLESNHTQMLATLAKIKALSIDNDRYVGNFKVQQQRQKLASLPNDASSIERWRSHFKLGRSELRLGNEDEAIRQLTRALTLISQHPRKLDSILETTYRLAIAHMRRAETSNCASQHNPEVCLLPLRGGGIHTDTSDSHQAIRYFTQVLNRAPAASVLQTKARWLLNIAYMTLGRYPQAVPTDWLIPEAVFQSAESIPVFKNIAMSKGLATFNLAGGVIVDDFNGDYYLDIMTSTMDPAGQLRLFHNNADGSFTERTEAAGLMGLYGGLNMVQADYDNDGDIDVLILRGAWLNKGGRHPNSLLRNNGDGSFVDVTFAVGLGETHYPTQAAAWADYDNDGDLDLYIGNEHRSHIQAPSQLFRNNGDGTFTDVAHAAGVENLRFVKAVVWGDYDGDRWPDLYTSTLRGANRLYHNNGDGTFTDVAPELGITGPKASFPAWFWDIDNDGNLDLYVSDYSSRSGGVAKVAASYMGLAPSKKVPALYRGNGKGQFVNVAQEFGLTSTHLPMGANFGDIDNDGYPDFYLGTGYPNYEALIPSALYKNNAGNKFIDVTFAGRLGHLQKGHGIAFADLDNDGDQDIFAQMGGAFAGDGFRNALYQNSGFGNHWLGVQLVGVDSNRFGVGARIRVDFEEAGKTRTVYQYVNSGGSFGANPLRQTIGLGQAERIKRLEVWWPTTGQTQIVTGVAIDNSIVITEGEDDFEILNLKPIEF